MHVTVLGGGLGGLAAAHYLLKHPNASKRLSKIVILESSSRLGGWVESTRMEDGVVYEHGPRTVRPVGHQGATTLSMIEDLGLQDKVRPIPKSHSTAKNRMIYVDGKICPLPNGLMSLFKIMPPFKKPHFLMGLKELTSPPKYCDDDSVFNLVGRRFGADAAQYLIDPMIRGICAGDAREISADAFVLSPVFKREQADGGLFKSLIKSRLNISNYKQPQLEFPQSELATLAKSQKWSVWSLEGGLSSMTEALRDSLLSRGVDIKTETEVESVQLPPTAPGKAVVNGFETDHVIAAVPACNASKLLQQLPTATAAPHHHKLSQLLSTIPYVDVCVVNVEYEGKLDLSCGPGFGVLVPSNQTDVQVLGVIFDTCMFPQGNRTIFTVMMGGRWFDSLFGVDPDPDELAAIAAQNIRDMLGVLADPVRTCAKIHRNCIAQYTVGHNQRVKEIRKTVADENLPISFVGSAFDGVGINDTIVSARNQVGKLLS